MHFGTVVMDLNLHVGILNIGNSVIFDHAIAVALEMATSVSLSVSLVQTKM